jgi:hypothetical protein
VILDTKGDIFGGFTPVEWEVRKWNRRYGNEDNCWKADPSLKSFLFALKNPHNVPARRFALKSYKNYEAIYRHPNYGPHFLDIYVVNKCNATTTSFTVHFSENYTNHTGLPGDTIFTGSEDFKVKEIEVFEIIE